MNIHELEHETSTTDASEPVLGTRRPHPSLFKYYLLRSLLFGPAFPFALVYHFFRYRTLRYRFDDEGVTMRWGALFRREISLSYGRIQDIHLVSNLVERWLGLARVRIQTAAGSAAAEMTLEGLPDFERLRDFLYTRMRGARGPRPATAVATVTRGDRMGEAVAALREAVAEIRALREAVIERPPESSS